MIKEIRELTTLLAWREEVIRDVFGMFPSSELMEANRLYYLRHIAQGTHKSYVASSGEGTEYGCGSVCFSEELPSPDNPSGQCAYLMNIYVRKEFRNRGIGHEIVKHLLSESSHRKCGKIYLETTSSGKPLYASLGFREMTDMMKYYDSED